MRAAVRDVDAISARVIQLREAYGLSPKEAYRRCEIDKTTWNNYECAYSRPSTDNAARICETFGVTLDWLYTGNTAGLSTDAFTRLFGKTA